MSSSPSNPVWYVYGIVPANLPPSNLPRGIDDGAVLVEPLDGIAALVTLLDAERYTPESIDRDSGEVAWLSPRAVAHDRVLTAASDEGAVVPLPMFSLFSGRDAVHTMLCDRATQLAAALQRIGTAREYALRVHRVDAELLAALPSLSPRVAELAATAVAASPGQRYLLERKLDGERKSEMKTVSQRIVAELMATLAPFAVAVDRSPIPRTADADAARGTMVLNAAFLIAPVSLPDFQRMLTTLVERHGAHGFRFDFTGPWPAYHFAQERES